MQLNACQCLYLSSQSLSVPLLSMRPTYGGPSPFPFAVPAPRWLHHSLAASYSIAEIRQLGGKFDLSNMRDLQIPRCGSTVYKSVIFCMNSQFNVFL